MAKITDRYYQWCQEAGWEPGPDQTVYRASIYLAETDQKAEEWFESLRGPQSRSRLGLSAAVEHAVQTARTSQPGAVYNPNDPFDLRNVVAGSPEGDVVGPAPALNFMGGPDTVVKQIQAVHDPVRHRGGGPFLPATEGQP